MRTDSFVLDNTKIMLSIIVPIYNSAKYLEKTLQSLLLCGVEKCEILCIDDGSIDCSVAIIRRYLKNDSRIKLYSYSPNKGASYARNYGIKKARGEFVSFVDSDDQVVCGAYSRMISTALKHNADAVKGNMLVKERYGLIRRHRLYQRKNLYSKTLGTCEEIQHLLQYQSYIFRRDLIRLNKVWFEEKLLNFQDPVFLSKCLPFCKKIAILRSPSYVHTIRRNSISTTSWSLNNFSSLVAGITCCYSNLQNTGHVEVSKKISNYPSKYWHKIEKMVLFLTYDECLMVFSLFRKLYKTTNQPLWSDNSSSKEQKFFQLLLEGKDNDALKLLLKHNKFVVFRKVVSLIR